MLESKYFQSCPSFFSLLGAVLNGPIAYETDSRLDLSNKAFVALKGERFDGFDFIATALKNKAKAIVWSELKNNPNRRKQIQEFHQKFPLVTFIETQETTLFLQDLAREKMADWRGRSHNHRVVGIAGSNGKTTTKEMIAFLLRSQLPQAIHATAGNLNNHLGVPHTILAMPMTTQILVLEMGSNHPGELAFLCDICTPDCGLITNIGLEHMEFFPTEKDVFMEESVLYHRVMLQTHGSGIFVLNGMDKFLSGLPKNLNTIFLGKDIGLQTFVDRAEIDFNGKKVVLNNEKVTGAHNFYNLAVAYVLCQKLLPNSSEQIKNEIGNFRPKTNRGAWIIYQGKNFYLDAYNANPSSMLVSLQGFFDFLQLNHHGVENSQLILGDMNELGPNSADYHQEIGEFLKQMGVVKPVFVGRFAESYARGFQNASECFESLQQFKHQAWPKCLANKEYFFLKASRSLQLESLLDITH